MIVLQVLVLILLGVLWLAFFNWCSGRQPWPLSALRDLYRFYFGS